MAKYRKCPNCGAINTPNLLSCKECGYDSLEFEKIYDDTKKDEPEEKVEDVVNTDDNVIMVRICDCGAHNPVQARKCLNCGEDISDIIPVPESARADEKIHFVLGSVDGNYAYELIDNLTIVGRENAMKEYLSSKQFVSRKHAELLVEQDKLYIKNHSTTNFTFVNNEKIEAEKYVELHDGDEIGLGGRVVNGLRQEDAAYMQVRIGTCM